MVYLFLADGFEEVEALTPVDILRRAGAQVRTVGVGSRNVTGSHGIAVAADIEENKVETGDMDMVILPGGPGHKNLEKSGIVRACVEFCDKNNRWIAAICAAPSILGHMGLLRGHSAVCFPGYEAELQAKEIPDVPVCVSEKIVTAKGAGVALDFALKLVEVLFGARKSQEIRNSIQCM